MKINHVLFLSALFACCASCQTRPAATTNTLPPSATDHGVAIAPIAFKASATMQKAYRCPDSNASIQMLVYCPDRVVVKVLPKTCVIESLIAPDGRDLARATNGAMTVHVSSNDFDSRVAQTHKDDTWIERLRNHTGVFNIAFTGSGLDQSMPRAKGRIDVQLAKRFVQKKVSTKISAGTATLDTMTFKFRPMQKYGRRVLSVEATNLPPEFVSLDLDPPDDGFSSFFSSTIDTSHHRVTYEFRCKDASDDVTFLVNLVEAPEVRTISF